MATSPHRLLALLLLLACGTGGIGAAEPAAAAAAARPRLVMCWYMMCFFGSIESYRQEIELAQRHGIDGFLLDVGQWPEQSYVDATARMYEAAKQVGGGFKLAMAPEYSVPDPAHALVDMVARHHGHPAQLQVDGRDVLAAYGVPLAELGAAKAALHDKGIDICLLPHPFPPRFEYLATPERVQRWFTDAPFLDGLVSFDAKPAPEVVRENAIKRRVTRGLGKLYAAAVIPAYNSANLEDYHGLAGYGAMWEGAIRDGADWISLVIWNDYNEDSNLMPFRWPGGAEKDYFDRDESFLQATAYYSSWFKTGTRPAITQDRVFVTHRTRGAWQRRVIDPRTGAWSDLTLRPWPYDQIHGNVEDRIYLDAFLAAPATVELACGDGPAQRFTLAAGVAHAEAPLQPGVPRLAIIAGDGTRTEVVSRRQVIAEPTAANSVVGEAPHLVNRTWASGTALGPVRRLEAESGTLLAGARVVPTGAITAVENAAADGSGFRLPVAGLQDGTYNIRIVYCNPAADDARLTLSADGPPLGAQEHARFIPAWLPPTGEGRFRTVSFLWSLHRSTTWLQVAWESGRMWGQAHPEMDDRGVVRIDAIELVAVEPFRAGAPPAVEHPPLVAIPGGTFAMGSDDGDPDERPVHPVTVSPFAIGRCEVTNAEYERCDPAHAEARTSLSWRDGEPVIAVSWVDAVRYCNWLSARNHLAPAYAEAGGAWQVDLRAEGFRLPTEAEWEYVASGRGEGRRYPWGAAAPEPMLQGNFQGRRALDLGRVPAADEGGGTMTVGSFPLGASRDGVLDLAGNVGEWCSDWYGPYAAGAQQDPCGTTQGNYRAIRGGSWGWYNWDQRCAKREFNSPGYPGHCYYGFRVAITDAGWRKLGSRP